MPEPRSCPTSACLQPPRGIITKASNSEAGESHRIPTLASCDTSLVNRPFSFFIPKPRCRTSHVSDCTGCAIQQPLCEAACPPPIWASSSELPTAKVNCAASPGLPSGSPWQDSVPPKRKFIHLPVPGVKGPHSCAPGTHARSGPRPAPCGREGQRCGLC